MQLENHYLNIEIMMKSRYFKFHKKYGIKWLENNHLCEKNEVIFERSLNCNVVNKLLEHDITLSAMHLYHHRSITMTTMSDVTEITFFQGTKSIPLCNAIVAMVTYLRVISLIVRDEHGIPFKL